MQIKLPFGSQNHYKSKFENPKWFSVLFQDSVLIGSNLYLLQNVTVLLHTNQKSIFNFANKLTGKSLNDLIKNLHFPS